MTVQIGWVGLPKSPLFARLFTPEGTATRGGVLLCTGMGQDAPYGRLAFRELGRRLAESGFLALQVDYQGMGNSWGHEPGSATLEAWQSSLAVAAGFLRDGGAHEISAVGFRLGATLAASVANELALDALVLWDPCASGRSHLREQAMLRALYMDMLGLDPHGSSAARDGSVEILGATYDARTARELAHLEVGPNIGALARQVLVLATTGATDVRQPPKGSSAPNVDFAQGEGPGRAAAFENEGAGPLRIRDAPLAAIATWLDKHAGRQWANLGAQAQDRSIRPVPDGISEEVWRVGPDRLFGILARPARPTDGPAVVILSAGFGDHLGPGRLWVEVSREWANLGVPVLRTDLSGLGDTPARPGRAPGDVYPSEALGDIKEVVEAVSAEYPAGVVLMGLCSGGYHAALAAPVVGARGALVVNPSLPVKPLGKLMAGAARRLPRPRPAPGGGDYGANWWPVRCLGLAGRPLRSLERFSSQGGRGLVVCGPPEWAILLRSEAKTLTRLQGTTACRLELVPDADHSLFTQTARRAVLPLLTEYLLSNFGPPAGANATRGPVSQVPV